MVLIAGGFGEGLSRAERKKLRAEQKRLNEAHRKKAGKKNTATLSAPGMESRLKSRLKRKSKGRKIKPQPKTYSLMNRNSPVPSWAVNLCRKLTRWCRDTTIHFRAPNRGEKEDVWQVSVLISRYALDRQELAEVAKVARGLTWYLGWEKNGIFLKVWKPKRERK